MHKDYGRLSLLFQETAAGVSMAVIMLPPSLAAGALVFAAMGPEHLSAGVAAALYCVMFAVPVAALLALSSFVIASPRSDLAVVQASLVVYLLANPAFAGNPALIVAALSLCILLAGIIQIGFGLLGVGRIIRFTPHPVLAGFVNGIGLLLVLSQLRRFVSFDGGLEVHHPLQFLFVAALVALIIVAEKKKLKVSRALVGLTVGVVVYYFFAALRLDNLDLGPTLGPLGIRFPPPIPLAEVLDPGSRGALVGEFPRIVLTAAALALVASFDALLTLRNAHKIAGRPVQPVRDLAALGIGNAAAGLTGGMALTLSPTVTVSALRAGARTRLTSFVCAGVLLLTATLLPAVLAGLPIAVISAIVISSGLSTFDRWSIRQTLLVLSRRPNSTRRHALVDLSVVFVVMGITASGAVIEGVIAGFALSCLIFIVKMSRPIVSRIRYGDQISSRRIRSAGDVAILRDTGKRRAVLDLQGVLFFGNADDLAETVDKMFDRTDAFVFDLGEIADIDVSGTTVLGELVATAAKSGKKAFFCNVPDQLSGTVEALFSEKDEAKGFVGRDLDSTLEFVEERFLALSPMRSLSHTSITLAQHDLMRGLVADEVRLLKNLLVLRQYAEGEAICVEGELADRMWLITSGSVSVRLNLPENRGNLRVAGLATGTTVGEMALLESGLRSATVVADEAAECFELDTKGWRLLVAEQPRISNKIMANLTRVIAQRLRGTSDHLRIA